MIPDGILATTQSTEFINMHKKKKTQLFKVMTHLKIEVFQHIEIEFLSKYLTIMKKILDVLDLLQGEKNIGMGYLLPALSVLEDKLIALKGHGNMAHCQPL